MDSQIKPESVPEILQQIDDQLISIETIEKSSLADEIAKTEQKTNESVGDAIDTAEKAIVSKSTMDVADNLKSAAGKGGGKAPVIKSSIRKIKDLLKKKVKLIKYVEPGKDNKKIVKKIKSVEEQIKKEKQKMRGAWISSVENPYTLLTKSKLLLGILQSSFREFRTIMPSLNNARLVAVIVGLANYQMQLAQDKGASLYIKNSGNHWVQLAKDTHFREKSPSNRANTSNKNIPKKNRFIRGLGRSP